MMTDEEILAGLAAGPPTDLEELLGQSGSAPVASPSQPVVADPYEGPTAPEPILAPAMEPPPPEPVFAAAPASVPPPAPAAPSGYFDEVDMHEDRAAILGAEANRRVYGSAPNPVFPSVQKHTAEMEGIIQDQRQAAAGIAQSEADVADAHVAAANRIERQYDEAVTDHNVKEGLRRLQRDEQRERQELSRKAMADASDKLAKAREYDPDRFWKDKTTGQKIAIAVGAILVGAGGGWHGDVQAGQKFIQAITKNELDKQKEAYRRLQNTVDVRERELGEEKSLYAQLMGTMQDEREADLAMESLLYKQAIAEVEAIVATAESGQKKAEAQMKLAAMNAHLSELEMKREQQSALTPRRVGRSMYAHGPEARAALLAEQKRELRKADRGEKLGMEHAKSGVRMREEDYKFRHQMEKQKDAQTHKGVLDQRKKTMQVEATMTTADGLLRLSNLQGHGVGGLLGRLANPREAARVREEIRSLGIDPDEYWREEALLGAIRGKRDLAMGELRAAKRGMSDAEHEAYYERQKLRDPMSMQPFQDKPVGGQPLVRED